MKPHKESNGGTLQFELETARENEKRWVAMSMEMLSDAEQMEQWRSTAKLRRQEVERLEGLLRENSEP